MEWGGEMEGRWRGEGTMELHFLHSPGGRQRIWTRWLSQEFWLTIGLMELWAAHQQRRLVSGGGGTIVFFYNVGPMQADTNGTIVCSQN